MQIIPVIDIKRGRAVLAKQGDRQNYQALSTPLCSSSLVDDVIDAYLSLHPFPQIYLADLDALMGTDDNQQLIHLTAKKYPQLNFIVDSALLNINNTPNNITAVIGTESVDKQQLSLIKQQAINFILSLDFCAQNQPMGDSSLHHSPHLWPKKLIIMSLALVGKKSGPELLKLQHYRQSYPEHDMIAAGGIRGVEDLIQLKNLGIQQTLVASALHSGTLKTADILSICK
ncbi:MAG: nickel transporter [Methyloprofundus sp.]|nr:nickel transporter [Methyloprofundus sp.]